MGFIADVVAHTPILSSWGNAIRNRTVMDFTNVAERSAQWVSPPEGAMSYLRDVDRVEVFNGTAWVDISRLSNGPRGEIAFVRTTSDVGITAGGIRIQFIDAVPLVNGRKYIVTAFGQVNYVGTPASPNVRIRVVPTGAVGDQGEATTIQRWTQSPMTGSPFITYSIIGRYIATATGTMQFQVWASTTGAATVVQGGGAFTELRVDDWGV